VGLIASKLNLKKGSERPLILRPGGLGDLILSQIAIENLGKSAQAFDWLIEKRSEAWAKQNNLNYFCYDDGINWTRKIFGKYELVINTEQLFGLSQAVGLLAKSSSGKIYSFATNRGVFSSKKIPYDWQDSFEVDEFAKLFAVALKLPPPPLFCDRKRTIPATDAPLLGIAGLQSPSRTFSVEQLAAMIRPWSKGEKFKILAAPADREFADHFLKLFPGQAEIIAGKFSDACDAIARSERLFSVDGGMVHIATYFGVPTTAVFTSGRDKKWAPRAVGSESIFRADLMCRPCTKFGQVPECPFNYACKNLRIG